jgi:integrase/recombinase XerD
MRRSLGFKLHEAGKLLVKFVTFMEQHHASYITSQLALAWAQQPATVQPAEWARRLSVVRTFARYRSAPDPRTQIPPEGLLPYRPKRARPYLYSDEEIRRLLRAALRMPHRYERGRLRPWTYHCLFGLLKVSGLRLGEARNLQLEDVDLKAAVLTIRGAKFGKTRLVPLHTSTCTVLKDYIARRQRHWAGRAVSSYLFVSSRGNRLDAGDIHRTFYALSRQIGLRGPSDRRHGSIGAVHLKHSASKFAWALRISGMRSWGWWEMFATMARTSQRLRRFIGPSCPPVCGAAPLSMLQTMRLSSSAARVPAQKPL